jgi:TctA family transporter
MTSRARSDSGTILIARGNLRVFVERPISVALLIAGVLLVAVRLWRRRQSLESDHGCK